jgi:hypothetical protein
MCPQAGPSDPGPEPVQTGKPKIDRERLQGASNKVQNALGKQDCVESVFGKSPGGFLLGRNVGLAANMPSALNVFLGMTHDGPWGRIIFTDLPEGRSAITAATGKTAYSTALNRDVDVEAVSIMNRAFWNKQNDTENALDLLHELGHVLRKMGWSGGQFMDDDVDDDINLANSDSIKKYCGKYL